MGASVDEKKTDTRKYKRSNLGYFNNLLSQQKLLGSGCPCQGCHRRQRKVFLFYAQRLGRNSILNKMAKALVEHDISFDRLAALEIMAIWLEGNDVAYRITFPSIFNEATKRHLESFRPQLRPVIEQILYMQGKMVEAEAGRHNFGFLQEALEPISDEAIAKIKLWLKHDANSRGVDPEEIKRVIRCHLPSNQLADPYNEPFEDRWAAYQSDGLKDRICNYFDPRIDAEKLIAKVLEHEDQTSNQLLYEIQKTKKIRWKRFAKYLAKNLFTLEST